MNQQIKFDEDNLAYLKQDNEKISNLGGYKCLDCERPMFNDNCAEIYIDQIELARSGYQICRRCVELVLFSQN